MSEDVTVSFEPHEWQPWPVRREAAMIAAVATASACVAGDTITTPSKYSVESYLKI